MDFIYTYCEEKQQDPTKWIKDIPNELEDILQLYNEGKNVKDIESNKKWKKRKDTLEILLSGNYSVGNDDEDVETSEEETGE